MTEKTCDTTVAFVREKQYSRQLTLTNEDGTVMNQVDAKERCNTLSGVNDFFVQQHPGGHTICGIYDESLTETDKTMYVPVGGNNFGMVCKSE